MSTDAEGPKDPQNENGRPVAAGRPKSKTRSKTSIARPELPNGNAGVNSQNAPGVNSPAAQSARTSSICLNDLSVLSWWVNWQPEGTRKRPFKPGTDTPALTGNPDKVDEDGQTGKPGGDPSTWGPLKDCRPDRIGIVLGNKHPASDLVLCGLDIDACRDPSTGAETTNQLINWLLLVTGDTYAEISPSQTGVKVFFWLPSAVAAKFDNKTAKLTGPKINDKSPGVELYFRHRFFTVTNMPDHAQRTRKLAVLDEPRIVRIIDAITIAKEAARGNGSAQLCPWDAAQRFIDLLVTNLQATSTGRNDALRDAGFSAGSIVREGCLTEEEVERRLIQAATDNGYIAKDGIAEARTTLRNAMRDGIARAATDHRFTAMLKPRAKAKRGPGYDDDDDNNLELDITRVSDVDMKSTEWIWPARIARGDMTGITGITKIGKGFLLSYIVATITTGRPWAFDEGGVPAPIGSVVWITTEDSVATRIGPRLVAAGADTSKVHVIRMLRPREGEKGRARAIDLTRDVERIEKKITQLGDVVLVIFDPLNEFLGTKLDGNSTPQVRAILSTLLPLAETHNFGIVAISHEAKVRQGQAVTAAIGSQAFSSRARINTNVINELDEDKQPTGRKFFAIAGATDAEPEEMRTYVYHIETCFVKDARGKDIKTGALVWDEVSTLSAQEIYSPAGETKTSFDDKLKATRLWLRNMLHKGEPIAVKQIVDAHSKAMSDKTLDSSRRALDEAARHLGVERKQLKGRGQNSWFIPPPKWPEDDATPAVQADLPY